MSNNQLLNLLVIDDNQLYAEKLVSLLSNSFEEINLGLLDDKEELIKNLRHKWDVLVLGKGYHLDVTDVVGILQEHNVDLPIICLSREDIPDESNYFTEGLPNIIDSMMVRSLPASESDQIILAIRLYHAQVQTQRKLSELRYILSEAEQRANILIKNSKSAVAYLDQGIHIYANDPYLEMFGFESEQDIIGVPVIDLIAGGDNVKDFKNFLKRFEKGSRKDVEFKFESRRKDGSTFEAKLQLATATFNGQPVIQVIIQHNEDAMNSAEVAKQLAAAERQDNLTGLANRLGFEERFNQFYNDVIEGITTGALLFVRIDSIGKINSSLGLKGIDTTIKQVAYMLDDYFKDGFVGRFSDSTFAILVSDVTRDQIEQQANILRENVANMMIEVGKRTTETTISIGIVMLDRNVPEQSVLIDRAMDSIKQILAKTDNAGNAIHLYDPSHHANDDDDALAEALINAITHNSFKLLYQPVYDVDTDSSNLYEVYIRLPLPDGSEMAPEKFASVAKDRDLLGKIDRWTLINACKALNQFRQKNADAKLLIQLSSSSLADNQLPDIASKLIKALGGQSDILTVQFNEQDVLDYLAVAKKQFIALTKVDCSVSISYFGSTAKSIEIAESFKPNLARLARNYVSDLGKEENLETVKSLVADAKTYGIDVLMPYIEEASTMSVAWSVGARYLQGNYLQPASENLGINE